MVTKAENGLGGLEQLRRSRLKVDLIICDLEMPEMNGLQLIESVRKGGGVFDAKVPIVVLTGHADEEVVHNALKLGINGYLVKPVSRASLEKRMLAALKK